MLINFPPVLTLSHSKIKTWRNCQQAYHYRYVDKLQTRKKALPLLVGTAVHQMLEQNLETGSWSQAFAAFEAEFSHLFPEELEELGNRPEETKAIVEGYLDNYLDDGLHYPAHHGRRAEHAVKVYIDNETCFIGYIDAYPEDSDGKRYVLDHKTCKAIPDENARFSDLQLVIYCWLLPLSGYPRPDGVIWDYIRTKAPTIPARLKNGEFSKNKAIDTTYRVYKDTVINALGADSWPGYEEFAEQLRGREDNFFRRVRLPAPSQDLIGNVVRDLLASANEIRTFHDRAATPVRNMTRDCSWCEFFNLCSLDVRGLDTEHTRKNDYETRTN